MQFGFRFIALALLLFSGLTLADESADRMGRLRQIISDVEAARQAAAQAWSAHPSADDPAVRRTSEAFQQRRSAAYEPVFAVARADPDSKTGFAALEWLLLQAPQVYGQEGGKPALEWMTQFHAENPDIGKALAQIGYYPPSGLPIDLPKARRDPAYGPFIELMQKVVQKNPNRTARAQAALALARQQKRAFDYVAPDGGEQGDRLAQKAIAALAAVVHDYGDCPNLRTMGVNPPAETIGGETEPELYELQHLRIGSVAPDIAGEDLDGAPLKLGNYRGKIVLLVFWASWCGPCMAAVPHERELANLFKDRPFVVIGVNGDESRQSALKAVAKEQIPWRSFWNGDKGSGGPIATAWNVRGWPTTYLIDATGVIRHKDLYDKALDESVEKLVKQFEAAREVK